jgi:hypothetical protein
LAGDKSGQWEKWYRAAISRAELLYEDYLAERRKEQVASRMGVWLRGSPRLRAAMPPPGLLSRFAAAVGGTLKLIADFGDERLKLA